MNDIEYEFDMGGFAKTVYAKIVNSKLPKEIKDSWLQVGVEHNVNALYN